MKTKTAAKKTVKPAITILEVSALPQFVSGGITSNYLNLNASAAPVENRWKGIKCEGKLNSEIEADGTVKDVRKSFKKWLGNRGKKGKKMVSVNDALMEIVWRFNCHGIAPQMKSVRAVLNSSNHFYAYNSHGKAYEGGCITCAQMQHIRNFAIESGDIVEFTEHNHPFWVRK